MRVLQFCTSKMADAAQRLKLPMKEVSKGVVLQVAAQKENTGHHRAAKASRKGREESRSRKGPRQADVEHGVAC